MILLLINKYEYVIDDDVNGIMNDFIINSIMNMLVLIW